MRLCIAAADGAARERIRALAAECGFAVIDDLGSEIEAETGTEPETVLVTVARTVLDAIAACPESLREAPRGRRDGRERGGWVLIAETFTPSETLSAVRAGAHAMLRSANATAERLAAAVDIARRGEGLMPYEVLVQSLGGIAANPPAAASRPSRPDRPAPISPLTGRQLAVLALIADGHDNAAIARELDCSQHTVKNVIYDLTARLQVRNRAQAVACAVRKGLI